MYGERLKNILYIYIKAKKTLENPQLKVCSLGLVQICFTLQPTKEEGKT
jgi:hypothetical protein